MDEEHHHGQRGIAGAGSKAAKVGIHDVDISIQFLTDSRFV